MKVQYSVGEAETCGIEVSEFNIDLSKKSKLFGILSDSLYKHKAMSMIRELCSNAHDSHVMKGNVNTAFDITIPTYSDNYFVIRDYGVGLDSIEAEDTIFSYLGSAKDTSDDFIGGWGLGSKSPYAYTDNFEVTLYKNGTEWVYQCWKDESGLPQHGIFSENSTTEPNGVKITVPVLGSAVSDFKSNIIAYLNNTNFKFNVTNNDLFSISPAKILHSFSHNGFEFSVSDHYEHGEFIMLYGGFVYKVNEIAGLETEVINTLNSITKTCNNSIIVHTKIGDCDFSVSRESLASTPKTLGFVNLAIKSFIEYLSKIAIDYHTEVIDKLSQKLKEAKINETCISLSQINEIQDAHDSVDNSFGYFNYDYFVNNVASPEAQILLKPMINDAKNLTRINIHFNKIEKYLLSNKKFFNSKTHFKVLSNYYKGYNLKIRSNICSDIQINALSTLHSQYVFTWSSQKVYSKYIANLNKQQKILVVECPSYDEAIEIYKKLGIVNVEVIALEKICTIKTPPKKQYNPRNNVVLPTQIVCSDTEVRHSYYDHRLYVYITESEWEKNPKFLSQYNEIMSTMHTGRGVYSTKIHFFVASNNFLKKYKNSLNNVIHYKDFNINKYINFKQIMKNVKHDLVMGANDNVNGYISSYMNETISDVILKGLGYNTTKLKALVNKYKINNIITSYHIAHTNALINVLQKYRPKLYKVVKKIQKDVDKQVLSINEIIGRNKKFFKLIDIDGLISLKQPDDVVLKLVKYIRSNV